jgi:type IV secretion system protein VirD4
MIKKIAGYILGGIVVVMVLGYLTAMMLTELVPAILTRDWGRLWNPGLLLKPAVWIYGAVVTVMVYMLYLVFHVGTVKRAKRLMKAKEDSIESSLENSRFMTDKEKDDNFSPKRFTRLKEEKKDGIPVYAVYNKKKKELNINIAKPMHGLVIGATGSGKTTSFINPMIQILGKSSAGSSMICTDPKGELFQLHSGMLRNRAIR